jgi:outer membrane protein
MPLTHTLLPIALAGALASTPAVVLAAPAKTPTPKPAAVAAEPSLSLADVVLLARDNSLGAQLGRRKLETTLAQRSLTYSNAFPSLGIHSEASYNQLPAKLAEVFGGFGAGGIPGFPAPGIVVDNTLSARQVLFDAFATRDAVAIADYQLAIGNLAVYRAEQDAMLNAGVGYFEVLRAEGLAGVAATTVKQAQEHLRLGQLRLDAGTGTRAEVLQLRAQLAGAQGALVRARNAVNLARLTLSNAVNAPLGDRPLSARPDVPTLRVSPDTDLAASLERRPELQQLSLAERIDETRVGLESRALWPTVSAIGRYSQRGFYQGIFTAGFDFDWALFDGFKVRSKIEAARSEAEATKVQAEQARQQVALEIRQQYQNREETRARIAVAKEGLASAQEAYRLALDRFKVGLASPAEVSDVQATLIQASNDYVQATNDLGVAELRLARALGTDLGAYLAASPTTLKR